MQNMIFHFYYFGKSFWNVNNKKLSSFAQLTKKLPGIGCWGKENKLSMEFFKNLSKMLFCIHRHKYFWYYLFFVFFIELCAWAKLYSGTPDTNRLFDQNHLDQNYLGPKTFFGSKLKLKTFDKKTLTLILWSFLKSGLTIFGPKKMLKKKILIHFILHGSKFHQKTNQTLINAPKSKGHIINK